MNTNKVAKSLQQQLFQWIQARFLHFLKAKKLCCLDVISFQKMPAMYYS